MTFHATMEAWRILMRNCLENLFFFRFYEKGRKFLQKKLQEIPFSTHFLWNLEKKALLSKFKLPFIQLFILFLIQIKIENEIKTKKHKRKILVGSLCGKSLRTTSRTSHKFQLWCVKWHKASYLQKLIKNCMIW